MAVLELLLRYEYAEQNCVNRWNYISSGDVGETSASFALVAAFGAATTYGGLDPDTIMADLVGNLVNTVSFQEIQVKDVYSTTDFYTRAFSSDWIGQVGTAGSSPIEALGYRTNRVRSDVARGTKRFAGTPNTWWAAEGVMASGVVAAANALGEKMSEVLEYSLTAASLTFTPAVCGKLKYVTPKGNNAYKYHPSEAVQLAHTAQGVDWTVYNTARSQVSRQRGRGS